MRLCIIAPVIATFIAAVMLSSAHVAAARAVTKQSCEAKARGCIGRCEQGAATGKGGIDSNKFWACSNRTCEPQFNNCMGSVPGTAQQQPKVPPKKGGRVPLATTGAGVLQQPPKSPPILRDHRTDGGGVLGQSTQSGAPVRRK